MQHDGPRGDGDWDHSSTPEFFDYYAKASESPATLQRYRSFLDVVLRVRASDSNSITRLEVADVGCGAGTQSLIWAGAGHAVHGLDVNQPLIDLARERAAGRGLAVDFRVGTATALPWESATMDVCLVPELLEHVSDWRSAVHEAVRVLRPGGTLLLSTTNRLCPRQQEFRLPLYSWYPTALKRRYERLASTTRPELVNFAKYPAVHWFTYYQMRDALRPLGLSSRDRFDVMRLDDKGVAVRAIVTLIQRVAPLRWLGHVATPYTLVVATRATMGSTDVTNS